MIRGLVQGVGFRPFIFRLATRYGLLGEVENRTNGVKVTVQGDMNTIGLFTNEILSNAPPASVIKEIEIVPKLIEEFSDFRIAWSKTPDDDVTEISPDIAVCEDCLAEMSSDVGRIDYPFINCTNCGPRFSIIESIPYDRPGTTMRDFQMCPDCSYEYKEVLDRRFHAQPVGCNKCGPRYEYLSSEMRLTETEAIINETVSGIAAGSIVAVKGIGGYHFMCDALNEEAVSRLRIRKLREGKPFAVMFRSLAEIKEYCQVSQPEEKLITSWRRPILLLLQKKQLASSVSVGLDTTGAMLPFMPFHYLLFRKLATPAIVLTSANFSDDPVIADDGEASECLLKVADSLVSHNRKIANRSDDSVVRIIDGRTAIIRRSRGYVPHPVDLRCRVEGILASGGEQKNTFCIGKANQAILSQHIGNLRNIPVLDFYKEMIEKYSSLFRFRPEIIACDLHPDYFSTRYSSFLANELKLPLCRVQHHHAHIVSCMAEHGLDEKVIGISLDGTGFGTDGNTWGGEFLIADCGEFERITHFDYIPVPGGDKAVDEPWRMAFSYIYKYFGDDFDYSSVPVFKAIDESKLSIVRDMIRKGINTPLSSGAGRLFDAVAALLGLCSFASFDSEGPMRLESLTDKNTESSYPFSACESIVFADTLKCILSDLPVISKPVIAAKFQNTLAEVILKFSQKIRNSHNLDKVVLSGGVFQNKYLLETSSRKLERSGFHVYTNHLVPSNDGGISVGQLVVASKKTGLCV